MNKFAQLSAEIVKLWTKYSASYLSGMQNTLILALVGTLIGSIIIRTIVNLVYYFGIAAEATMAFKAVIIAVVIVLQSEPVRNYFAKRSSARREAVKGGAKA